MSTGKVKILILRSMSERKRLGFHIRKLETKTNGCDKEWREKNLTYYRKHIRVDSGGTRVGNILAGGCFLLPAEVGK